MESLGMEHSMTKVGSRKKSFPKVFKRATVICLSGDYSYIHESMALPLLHSTRGRDSIRIADHYFN